jgi:hypothetical protein
MSEYPLIDARHVRPRWRASKLLRCPLTLVHSRSAASISKNCSGTCACSGG